MTKSYDYILFDWDGNIAKTLDVWLHAHQTVLRRHGVIRTDKQIAASFGATRRYAEEDWGVDFDEMIPKLHAIAVEQLPHVELYPNALDVIETLYENGKNLALISSSTHSNISIPLLKYDMMHFFGAIISADEITHHKPHPEPLQKALAALGGTDPSRAIMIGDSDKDIGAAKNFGCDSILFHPPEHRKYYNSNELHALNPTYVVCDFAEILDIIR